MERKSGSSSRSPSLSRRPSLKDKKPAVISKSKKKVPPGAKKERWLLTRKTWRYMSDAVGNLLPEYQKTSRRGSVFPTLPETVTAEATASVHPSSSVPTSPTGTNQPLPSGGQGARPHRSLSYQPVDQGGLYPSSHQPLLSHHHQRFLIHDQQQHASPQHGQSHVTQQPHQRQSTLHYENRFHGGGPGSSTAGPSSSSGSSYQHQPYFQYHQYQPSTSAQSGGKPARVTSPTHSSSAVSWTSFPSHRPGVTPTGPGPGVSSSHGPHMRSGYYAHSQHFKYTAPIDPEDIPAVEQHFEDVCNKEKKFLLWTKTKAKGLSGPALREMKLQKKGGQQQGHGQGSSGQPRDPFHSHQFHRLESTDSTHTKDQYSPDYFSPDDDNEFDREDEDEYDEYENEEEQVTVRERRKSSTASSTMSILGGMSFFRPLSGSHSDTSYAMIVTGAGVQKMLRNTGIQTDPFPEELLIRLRLQAVQEERQLEMQKQEEANRLLTSGSSQYLSGDKTGISLENTGMEMAGDKTGKETVIPISHSKSGMGGGKSGSSTESGRESEEKLLESTRVSHSSDTASQEGNKGTMGGVEGGSSAVESAPSTTGTADSVTDKKSEESGYSSSISDTVKRYLRMVRKNSKADNKETIDKFKTVNYDRSLRYIKSKNVTVEEALEHEKNKALALQNQQSGIPPAVSPTPASTEGTKIVPVGGTPALVTNPDTSAIPKTLGGTASDSQTPLNLTQSISSPVTPTLGGQTQGEMLIQTAEPSIMLTPGRQKVGQVQQVSLTISPTALSPTNLATASSKKVSSSATQASTAGPIEIGSTERDTCTLDKTELTLLESPKLGETQGQVDNLVESKSPLDASLAAPICPSVGIQAGESLIKYLKNLNPMRKLSDFSSTTSYCSSESPVEITSPRYSIATTVMSSASEGEMFLQHQAALASMINTGMMFISGESGSIGGIPTTTRSSFDTMISGTDCSEFEDVFNNYHVYQASQYSQQQQQYSVQQQQQYPQGQDPSSSSSSYQYSSATSAGASSSASTTVLRQRSPWAGGNLEGQSQPIPCTNQSGSGYPYSSAEGAPSLYSTSPSRRSQLRGSNNPSLSASSKTHLSTSTPSTPMTGSGAGSTTSGGGGLMRSFFSSSPFSSSFGLGAKVGIGLGLKKPRSTTSLVTPSRGLGGVTSSSRLSGVVPPPTTSSSPNLLSLIQSSASSLVGGSKTFGMSSGGGSTSDLPRGSIPSVGSSSTDNVLFGMKYLSRNISSDSGQKGSLVQQKGQMSLPLGGGGGSGEFGGSSHSHSPTSTTHGPGLCRESPTQYSSQKGKSTSSDIPQPQQQASEKSSGGGGTTPTGGPSASAAKLLSKSTRIFKARSKSSTRATSSSGSNTNSTCSWAPQGKCKWKSIGGKVITLEATEALGLSEVERLTLQEVALEKLKTISLGVEIKVPKEKYGAPQQKPKRRPYLLKKKAFSTGFFDSGNKPEEGKAESGSDIVFGVSLSQCVAADRLKGAKKLESIQGVVGELDQPRRLSKTLTRNSIVCDIESLQPPLAASVPALVVACVNHLENYGLHTTGIFRVSTSLKRIRQLREDIDAGKEIEFGEEHSPHDVAALLKEFLRDLPDPLLSRELYQAFLKTQRIRNRKQQLEATQHLIQLLPVSNRDTLACLLKFFAKVTENAAETRSSTGEILPGNKMEGYSLATLIAPNILPCMPSEGIGNSTDQNLTKERRESIDVVNYMISNYSQLFEVSSELLHDVYLHMMDTNPDAVEGIFKTKFGLTDDPGDEIETNSVFELGEAGASDAHEVEDPPSVSNPRTTRRREEVLHEGAAKGGISFEGAVVSRYQRRKEDKQSDLDKQLSGGESDSSSTKSASKWFRRTRTTSKIRTSSDSGSEKVKQRRNSGQRGLDMGKRASSLECVNIKEAAERAASSREDRQKSNSDQSLRVPENQCRRQSSPTLDTSGVITASLKIPVPLPLNIDDTDIPFIEDDHNDHHQQQHHHPHSQARHSQKGTVTTPTYYTQHSHQGVGSGNSRGRSASTDSSAVARTPSSSHTTTPISSPVRHPSSEVSSPLGFSPPGSPPYERSTFPYEEFTSRILIGPSSSVQGSTAPTVSYSTPSVQPSIMSSMSLVSSSMAPPPPSHIRRSSPLKPRSDIVDVGSSEEITPTPSPQPSPSRQPKATHAVLESQSETDSGCPQPSSSPPSASESKGIGKETKGTNIGCLIKSKTADFEKLAKSSASLPSPGVTTPTTTTVAPKMRLRSQDNIALKQQFLLRQQQSEGTKSPGGKVATTPIISSKEDTSSSRPIGSDRTSRVQEALVLPSVKSSSVEAAPRRRRITETKSLQDLGAIKRGSGSNPSHGVLAPTGCKSVEAETSGQSGAAGVRWKRSEIIASKQPGATTPTKKDPETFL